MEAAVLVAEELEVVVLAAEGLGEAVTLEAAVLAADFLACLGLVDLY